MKASARFVLGGLLAVGLLAAVAPAHADTVVNFDVDFCGGGCGTPPFGAVTLHQNGANVDVTVHLNSPNQFVTTGAGDSQVFLFNATGVVLGDISIDVHAPALTASATGFDLGGHGGLFAFGISCPSCSNGAGGAFSPDIVFHVANALVGDFLSANAAGYVFAADIISAGGTAGGTGNTGVVAAGAAVPEPSTLLLLGSGLAGAGAWTRRRLASRWPFAG